MPVFKDITLTRFGRLTALRLAERRYAKIFWECRCDCGNTVSVSGAHLKNGHTQSCGCLIKETVYKNGVTKSPVYDVWKTMLRRCLNPEHADYPYYGGRGIAVCDRWKDSFPTFAADMGERPRGWTIDRINNDGPYAPENCRWASQKTQCNNKSNNIRLAYNGKDMTMKEWSEYLGISYHTIRARYHRGLSPELIFKRLQLPDRGS